ncbi:MAG: peptidoglycan DD-metalloendopeptidase family protein [Elusimicrobia bacterium]|nr:peptidoglycan DD-metalloendopeptidase family protein [Elusimicrobiota bacterium]
MVRGGALGLLGVGLLTVAGGVLGPLIGRTQPHQPMYPDNLLVTTPLKPVDPEVLKRADRLLLATHRARPGEDVWSIAKRYGTDGYSLLSTNGLEAYRPKAGQPVKVSNIPGFLYTVKQGETLRILLQRFQRGREHPELFLWEIIRLNDLPPFYAVAMAPPLPVGLPLFLPHVYPELDMFTFPNWRRTSGFGVRRHPLLRVRRFHEGWDLAKPYGTPVFPIRKGIVSYAGWKEGYGNLVTVRHSDGMESWYGHLSSVRTRVGRSVTRSTLIGRVGSTGLSTGPHLHLEVRNRQGNPINPSEGQNYILRYKRSSK